MIVMLCTRSRGGMRSVVESYQSAGLFERRHICLLQTHNEGPFVRRLALALHSLLSFSWLLVRGRVSLVHAHISTRGSFWRKCLFAIIARRFRVPFVGHLHGSDFHVFFAEQPAWLQTVMKSQLERMTTVLVLGEKWRQFVISVAPGAHVQIMRNCVRLPAAQAPHVVRDRVTLLFLGIVGHRKGIFELLQAFVVAHTVCPTLRLTVAGNGDIELAQRTADELGIGDFVNFVGWIGGAAKHKLLADADIYVLPSHNEGLPMSIIEAMSWGLPIISTDVGAIGELVRHGIDGLIVPAGEAVPLAHALVQLASSQSLRLGMGSSGRRRVEEGFSEQVVLPHLEAIYDELQAVTGTSGKSGDY